MDITRENFACRREDGGWTVPKTLDGFSEMMGAIMITGLLSSPSSMINQLSFTISFSFFAADWILSASFSIPSYSS